MRSTNLRLAGIAAIAALAMATTATAFASGPGGGSGNGTGENGRSQIHATCTDGTTTFDVTVAVPNGGNNSAAAQVVGAKGHYIPAGGTFSVVDTTTATDLFSGPIAHGNGHSNQDTIECTGTQFAGTASDFFGTDLPPGVAPADTIEGQFDILVVAKP